MPSCPSVRVRNTGSGYVKPDVSSTAEADLKAKLAERAAQDATLWKPVQKITEPDKTKVPQ